MRLSKLHIAGFKSFPDRAELGFETGVTAIVGPNGCGKSNVVDAITLGARRAERQEPARRAHGRRHLQRQRRPQADRGSRGPPETDQRGAGGDARPDAPDVDALLDEQPVVTRDVEIGRRLYRSGESEYLIDGEVCRLRDVHDLLMDSGLGVKAYAVIEQGKIGQILSSRPAERRALIEEAAGVTKYKARRRAAELKLEAAQQNLTRVDDIIFEVEKQRGALKRQAARARRYRRLREELRRWEQVQFAHRHEALSREIEAADARLEDARAREAAAAAHVAGLETALEGLRLELAEGESGLTGLRERVHAHELDLGRWQQQVLFDKQQIEELARQAEIFDEERRELENRRAPAAQAIENQRAAAAAARTALDEARLAVEACAGEYREALAAVQGVELESDSTRAAVLSSNATLSALAQARDNAAAVRERVAIELERLDLEARELSAEIERTRREEHASTEELAATRAELDRLRAERVTSEESVAGKRAERDELGRTLAERRRTLAGREARLRSLEEIEASRSTFGDAARFLLGEAGAALQCSGAVADHLQVDRSFERAVDALMGDALQHVLVRDLATVPRALELLSGANAGRCGFLVLDEAPAGDAPGPLVVPPGARSLADVVRPVGPYGRAIAGLIRPALIVSSFEEARRLAPTVAVPVATLAGEVFRGTWHVEGGFRQDVRGILESRAEAVSLREEVTALEAEIEAATERFAACERDLPAAEAALSALVTSLHEREKAIVGFEARASRLAGELSRVERRLDVIGTEQRRAHEEEAAAESRRAEAVAVIAAHEARQVEAQGELSGVLTRLQSARETAETVMRRVTEARTEQAALGERVTALENELARLEEGARELEARVGGRQADIERTETRRAELRVSIADTERRLDEGVVALDELEDRAPRGR